jgi:hypothetical protein
MLLTFDQGDPVISNPTTGNLLRAGDLKDRTIYFRGLDAYAPNHPMATDLHEFLFTFTQPSSTGPGGIDYAAAGQETAATFPASDGQVTLDPNQLLPPGQQFFETPFTGPLP